MDSSLFFRRAKCSFPAGRVWACRWFLPHPALSQGLCRQMAFRTSPGPRVRTREVCPTETTRGPAGSLEPRERRGPGSGCDMKSPSVLFHGLPPRAESAGPNASQGPRATTPRTALSCRVPPCRQGCSCSHFRTEANAHCSQRATREIKGASRCFGGQSGQQGRDWLLVVGAPGCREGWSLFTAV